LQFFGATWSLSTTACRTPSSQRTAVIGNCKEQNSRLVIISVWNIFLYKYMKKTITSVEYDINSQQMII